MKWRDSLKSNRKRLISFLLLILVTTFLSNQTSASAETKNSTNKRYEVTMPNSYMPKGLNGGFDDYRCFLINPNVKQDSILTSIQFVPQNAKIVHHAILFRLPSSQVNDAKALDENGKGWSCFGGSGVGTMFQSFVTSPWLSAWVPGRTSDSAPNGYGYPFNKGDQIVLQVHYNLLAANLNGNKTDRSKIIFNAAVAKGSKVKTLGYELFPAPVELACPSGVSGPLCDRKESLMDLAARTSPQSALEVTGISVLCNQSPFTPAPSNTSTCDRKVNRSQLVVAAAPHMHLLGRSLKITLNPNSANSKILLNNTNYNFDDQSAKVLTKPVKISAGDTVRVECTFDPTLRQKIPVLKKLAPKYITWGEGSGDEMCLGVLITSNELNG